MRRVAMVLGLLLLTAVGGLASEPGNMQDFLAGKVAPFTMKLKDLDASYLRFTGAYGSVGGWLAAMQRYGAGEGAPAYTQGRTVTIGNESYLIAYTVEAKGGDSAGMMYGRPNPNAPEPQPITENATLSLTLLGQRSLGAMAKVRPFKLAAELADYRRYLESYQEMVTSRSAMNQPMERAAPTRDNLKTVAMALDMFAGDHDGLLPPMDKPEAFAKALDDYVESADLFLDPETKESYGLNVSLSGKKISEIKTPAQTIAVYQTKPGADGKRGVVFVDFSVKRLTEAEWTDLKAKSSIP